MGKYSLAHLSDGALLSGLKANLANERGSLALVLAHIGEVEARESYKPAGHSSMHMYCVHELHLSKDAAYKRIRAAHLAREFPVIFEKVAAGSLRLTSLLILGSSLTPENVEELLAAAAFRSDFEVREILAERFPQTPVPTTIEPIGELVTLHAPADCVSEHAGLAAQPVQEVVNALQVKPIAPDLYKATFTMSRTMRDKLRRAKELLGYRKSIPDEAEILEAGLDLFIAQVEKRKFGSMDRRRTVKRSKSAAYISLETKRQVWERDGSQCTFTSENGVRCPETKGLECDHIEPVARGGDSSVENVRLRCRAHNQLEAERTFGKPFMQHKREQARANAAAKRKQREDAEKAAREARDHDELISWMGIFGYSAAEAELAAAKCPPRPGQLPEMRRLECLAFLREEERLSATGT